jgi:hypothetical protein
MALLPCVLTLLSASPVATESIPNDTPVHLGISLRFTHLDELNALRQAQQDPRSPDFRRWLTPQQFGERFGQPVAIYEEVTRWLKRGGLEVTLFPNRLFVEARGSAAQVEALLGAQLAPVEGEAFSVHQLLSPVRLPERLASVVLNISGLDTRIRFKHHIAMPSGRGSLGPQDLRRFYGLQPLLDQGYVGQGQKLVVLSTATPVGKGPSPVAINYFFQNISNATAPYIERVLPNPQKDVDNQSGANLEFELDVQMQSVGAPGADSITLLVAPASEVFTTGANDIVNNLPGTTAISISLGLCEQGQQQNDQLTGGNEIAALRQSIIQGVTQGQTWSAASGDNGANDCRNGMTVAVDFPSSIPEMVAAGGSSIPSPAFNASNAISLYQQEVTWNDGAQGGAAGGGRSIVFATPAYQASLFPTGTGRSVPDIALISGLPAVAVASALPPGLLGPVEGTSVASPLSAGFFALIASRVGCRLGDIHVPLYALGSAQQDGGTAVFHDITSGNLTVGNVTGPAAGPGYDSATGWGSLNVAAIAAAWPACPALPDGGVVGAPPPGPIYSQCGFMACDGGCTTLPQGPSTCSPACNVTTGAGCSSGTVCSNETVYASGNTGSCVPGCLTQADCSAQPGTVCSSCAQMCVPAGNANGQIGTPCSSDSQCPSQSYCSTSRTFGATGYCTQDCSLGVPAGSACSCPTGSVCGKIGRGFATYVCLASCSVVGQSCGRSGYTCQPQNTGGPVCMPNCTITLRNGQMIDSCTSIGTSKACDVASGVCGGRADAGTGDAGNNDAGATVDAGAAPDAGPTFAADITLPAASNELGAELRGCGCAAIDAPLWAGALALLLGRRRSRRPTAQT